jgi:hypothetical protein
VIGRIIEIRVRELTNELIGGAAVTEVVVRVPIFEGGMKVGANVELRPEAKPS